MAAHHWAMVVLVCEQLAACGGGGKGPSGPPDSGRADVQADSPAGASCPSLGAAVLPVCVEAGEVNPNRVALATVTETSSTNSDGYTFTLYDDGSAEGAVSMPSRSGAITQQSCHLPPLTPMVRNCLDWLAQAGDISLIPTYPCAKSISFGTRTYVTYGGVTSSDLQCIDPEQYACTDVSNCTSLLGVPPRVFVQPDGGGG
jgi:hypothetical protein